MQYKHINPKVMATLIRLGQTGLLLFLIILVNSTAIHAQEAWMLVNNDTKWGMTCVSDSLIYAFAGGKEYPWIGNETWRYNTNTNIWTQLEDMPMAIYGEGIGQVGDKIYLVAGWQNTSDSDYTWITVDSIMEYDIATNTFIFKKKSPLTLGSMASCMMNEEMYLFGGIGSIDPETLYPKDVRIYDPVNEQWDMASVPEMHYPHLMHGTAEVLDGNIYVLGGVYGSYPNFNIQESEKFDGEDWIPMAEMPVPVALHTSVIHDDKILLFGGDSLWSPQTSISTNLIQEYDPLTDSWKLMEPMPFRGSAMVSGKVGNYIYLSGEMVDDRDPETVVSGVWRFNLDSLQEWCQEVTIQELSEPVMVGDSVKLLADVLPSDFANKTILWSSDNEAVAIVSDEGYMKGVDLGTATITAQLKYGRCSDSYEMNVIIDGNENVQKEYLTIYPNPTYDLITIKTDVSDLYDINITSLNGQLLLSKHQEGSIFLVDLAFLKEGVYFMTIRSKDMVITRKIIKVK